jgi:hypothetical protein
VRVRERVGEKNLMCLSRLVLDTHFVHRDGIFMDVYRGVHISMASVGSGDVKRQFARCGFAFGLSDAVTRGTRVQIRTKDMTPSVMRRKGCGWRMGC